MSGLDRRAATGAQPRGLHRAVVVVLVAGVVVTGALVVAAWAAQASNEDRLLNERTREASIVLGSVVPSVENPVTSAAELVVATNGDVASFRAFMAPLTGDSGPFVSASIWVRADEASGPLAVVGDPPALASVPTADVHAFFTRPVDAPMLTALDLLHLQPPRVGYSFASPAGDQRFVVYVEQLLPMERTSVRQEGEAFSNLDYALYFGDTAQTDKLIFASTPELPLRGRTDATIVRLGDTDLLLVLASTTSLGGPLLALLPWLILVVGMLVTGAFGALTERVLRRRDHAEELALEVGRVAEDNARLYGEQRSVAQTLQQSLLLETLPDVVGLEMAARYEAGADGLDVGGDWYDVITSGDGSLLVVVGDVSGRGVRAAKVMARVRYSIRAYAAQGDDPAMILRKLGALISLTDDGHFATVLIGQIDAERRTVSIANAGHPSPMVVDSSGTTLVETDIGLPVGVTTSSTYETVTLTVAPGATLLIFTDGLFERRGETIDVGLERLRASVPAADAPLAPMIDGIIDALTATSHDDAAILGIRWR